MKRLAVNIAVFLCSFLVGVCQLNAQVSPVEPGFTKEEILDVLADPSRSWGFSISQESEEFWILNRIDTTGLEGIATCYFEGDRCNRVLTEWQAIQEEDRVLLKVWYDNLEEKLDSSPNLIADLQMASRLKQTYQDGRSWVKIYRALDSSHQYIIVYYASEAHSFFSHMHQVYVWPEDLEN